MSRFGADMKTIVVATDLKDHSEAALEYARKLAGAYGAQVILTHCLDPMDYAAVDAVPGPVLGRMTQQARAVLDEMTAALIREGIRSHSEVRQGALVQMLLDVVRQYHAGLIVVGTKGKLGAGPVAVGVIAEELVRSAPCPVLAVAADWNAGEHRPVPGGPVMLAMDRNDAAEAAVDASCSLAETFHRTLIVVHARSAAETPALPDPCASTLEQLGLKTGGTFPVRCIAEEGNPVDAVARAIEQHSPCILVAGVKRVSSSPGPHGTILALLASSRVPVLCVPAGVETSREEREACIPMEIA